MTTAKDNRFWSDNPWDWGIVKFPNFCKDHKIVTIPRKEKKMTCHIFITKKERTKRMRKFGASSLFLDGKNDANFGDNLIVECLKKEETDFRFKLKRDFFYHSAQGVVFVVPAGFKTDFASVPWFFQRFIPKTGIYQEAAVVHDYLCYKWKKHKYSIEYRQAADSLFLEMMEVLGTGKIKRSFMHLGVALYTKALKYKLIKLKKGQY
jgi:hypothetical protein